MALVAFNLTGTDRPLEAGKPTPPTVLASANPPEPGPPLDVSSELRPSLTVDPVNYRTVGVRSAAHPLAERTDDAAKRLSLVSRTLREQ